MIERVKQILQRRRAYRTAFLDSQGRLTPHGEAIIADLKRFCRFEQSITVISPISRQTDVPASFQAEGRREVLNRILAHLHVSDADLVRIQERLEDHE
jgi:hypothetical protein